MAIRIYLYYGEIQISEICMFFRVTPATSITIMKPNLLSQAWRKPLDPSKKSFKNFDQEKTHPKSAVLTFHPFQVFCSKCESL